MKQSKIIRQPSNPALQDSVDEGVKDGYQIDSTAIAGTGNYTAVIIVMSKDQ